jgi:hypothetical protein
MKRMLLVATLATAVIALPAAFAASSADTQIAIERSVPADLADFAKAIVEPMQSGIVGGGKHAAPAETSPLAVLSSQPRAYGAGMGPARREAVPFHLRL